MAGVILNEGITGGPSPHLKVLQISRVDANRQSSDLLPYLPRFRHLFAPLPTTASQAKAMVSHVSLDDVEAVTQTSIKVRGPPWTIQFSPGIC